ncbi:MAG: hypothetical protein K2I69_07250 [Muribaculaceae bacterium]|nr:hypothetical protein [Muribaculaceae bacterium]
MLSKYILPFAFALFIGGTPLYAADNGAENISTEVSRDNAKVRVVSGGVSIENPGETRLEVTVYAITGAVVKHMFVDAGETMYIELPSGCYIVKPGRLATRVAVK